MFGTKIIGLRTLGARAPGFVAAITLLLAACAQAESAAGVRVLEDFESAGAVARWSFDNGAEFPGASGGFEIGPGQEGRGGVLRFAFSCLNGRDCNNYVSATLDLPSPLRPTPTSVLSFQFEPSADAELAIRLRDASGQTLQYVIDEISLEHQTALGWRRLTLPIQTPAPEHWDGADNGRISGGIVAISVLVRARGPARGAIGIDQVRVVDAAALIYALDPASAPPVPLSVAPPTLGVNFKELDRPEALDLARDAGIAIVRADLFWDGVESGGRFDFSHADARLDALEARGLGVLWILDYEHSDYGDGSFSTATERAAFQRYASSVAAHFRGRNVRYEIWNEPDVEESAYIEPARFAALLRDTARSVRAADAHAPIVGGGLSWADPAYFTAMLDALRDGGGAPGLDAIGIHLYRQDGPETAVGDVGDLRVIAADRLGRTPPLWITEWGYSATDMEVGPGRAHGRSSRERQAVFAARLLLSAWAAQAPLTVWYELIDSGDDGREASDNHGLLDHQGAPKPAYSAVRAFSGNATGRRLTQVLQDLPEGAHGLRLDGEADAVFALWCDAPGARVTVSLDAARLAGVQSALGDSLAPIRQEAGNVWFVVSEAEGPIYVRVRR